MLYVVNETCFVFAGRLRTWCSAQSAYIARHMLPVRCRAVSRGVPAAAHNADDGVAGEVPRSRCGIGGRAAAKSAAATRAHQREQLRTGCRGCVQVRTGAHGCATGAAFHTISHIAVRTSWRSMQLVIARGACAARVAESCREAGRTLLATLATAWQVKRRDGGAASLRVPQTSQLQPRMRISASRCAQGATGAHTCAHVLTGAQQVLQSRNRCCIPGDCARLHCERRSCRSAQLFITRAACAARVAEPCREAGRTLLATQATAWQVTPASQRSCAS